MRFVSFVFCLLVLLLNSGCGVKKYSDISYLQTVNKQIEKEPSLNIFTPKNLKGNKAPVLLFVHGGNWDSGNKEIYNFFGNNFARKGVITVVVGYTLSPELNYNGMTRQISEAIKWTLQNIEDFQGDPSQILLTGHSAGAHLISLAATNPKYNIEQKAIAGIILNDAAGLDMHHYLQNNPPTSANHYLTTWGTNPENWEDASPINFISEKTPPIKIYLGKKTYPSITTANTRFLEVLNKFQPDVKFNMLDKKHIAMMSQFFWPWNERYDEIIQFMEKVKNKE